MHLVDGRLRRSSRDGSVGNAVGVAEDYGDLAEGLLALHQATGEPRWLRRRRRPARHRAARTSPPTTAASTTPPTTPSRSSPGRERSADNVEPVRDDVRVAGALLTYGALTGSTRHLDAASAAVDAVGRGRRARTRGSPAGRSPSPRPGAAGPLQVAVVGTGPDG